MKYTDSSDTITRQQIRTHSGWGIAIGIILLILGIVAIARPLYATIASALVFGWVFLIAGIAQSIYAFRSYGIGQVVWKLMVGILYLVTGIYFVSNPANAAAFLTVALGLTIFAQGAIQVILAFKMRPAQNWNLILLSGLVGIIAGIFIWSRFPYSADWLIGLWVGIHLLISGTWILTVSSAVRSTLR